MEESPKVKLPSEYPGAEILLNVSDGPEAIKIYTSEEEGVIDWSNTFPAVYVQIALNGAYAKFGPFSLACIYEGLRDQIKGK